MRLISVSALKEWVENWFTKNRFYHPYAKDNNIPIVELYDILEQMPSAQPEWVPCSERLPKDDRTKIVTLANGNAECGYYSNGDWWCIGDSIKLENPIVIAWQPLPEPYREEGEPKREV